MYPDIKYLRDLAFKVGEIQLKGFRRKQRKVIKEDGTPVTPTDKQVNQLVLATLGRDFPSLKVIGEEGSNNQENSEYVVIFDPLDGTTSFLRKVPVFAFSIAVLKGNEPLVAVIFDPFLDRMWHARVGKGAYLNTKRIKVSSVDTLAGATINVYWGKESPFCLAPAQRKFVLGSSNVTDGALAYYGGLIALGLCEASILSGTQGWETPAMQLLAQEAGGKATDLHGRLLQYGPNGEIHGHIISNGLLHDQLVRLVNKDLPRM